MVRERSNYYTQPESLPPDDRQRLIYELAKGAIRAIDVLQGEDRSTIDFDVTSGPSHSEGFMMEVIKEAPSQTVYEGFIVNFQELLIQIESIDPKEEKDKHLWEFLRSRTKATIPYLQRLAGHEDSDNLKFIAETNSLPETEFVPENTINELKELVYEGLKEQGVEKPTQKNVWEWRKSLEIDQETAKIRLTNSIASSLNKVGRFIGEDLNVPFEVIPVNQDAYYYAWAQTSKGIFTVHQNFSKARRKVWSRGKVEEMGAHEGGAHLGRMIVRKRQIAKEKQPEYFGLTSVFGPEPIVDEGLGQTIPYFVPSILENMTKEGKLQLNMTILRNMVYSNLHLLVNRDDRISNEEATKYVQSVIPWENKEDIITQINDRTKNTLYQTYRYAYGYGAWKHYDYAKQLSEKGKKLFLKSLYEKPYTPDQEERLFKLIIRDSKNNSEGRSERLNPIYRFHRGRNILVS